VKGASHYVPLTEKISFWKPGAPFLCALAPNCEIVGHVYDEKGIYLFNDGASTDIDNLDPSLYLDSDTFSISGWFYVYEAGGYYLLSRQLGITPFTEYFNVRVDGNG